MCYNYGFITMVMVMSLVLHVAMNGFEPYIHMNLVNPMQATETLAIGLK